MTGDPYVKLVDDLDRSRRWLLFMAVVITCLLLVLSLLVWKIVDLSGFVSDSRGNRTEFQCEVEQRLNMDEVNC